MEWGSKLCMFEATMISDYRGSSTSGLLYNIKLIIRSVRQKAFQHDYHHAMKRNLTFSFDKNNTIEHMWQCRRIFFVTPKYKTRTKLKNIPEHWKEDLKYYNTQCMNLKGIILFKNLFHVENFVTFFSRNVIRATTTTGESLQFCIL